MFKSLKSKSGHHPDYTFLICVIILVVLGMVFLSSASSDLGKIRFNDTYYYLKHQLIYGLSFGVLGFVVAVFLYYRHWQKLAFPFLIISLAALGLIFTPLGTAKGEASRWLSIGFFSFQPSELLKFTFIIYLASWLGSKGKMRQKDFGAGYLPFLITSGLIAFLLLVQPATTTMVIIMAAALAVYFVSGARLSYVATTIFLGVLGFILLLALTNDYRLERIMTFMNPRADIQGSGYHLEQSKTAIGSGRLWGKGFGQSVTKYKYLPESIGDSIFAVIAEELGFVGVLGLTAVFLTLIMKGFFIAKNSRDQFAQLVATGFITIIALQTFIHIAAIAGIMPLTGVPLPFISYGGTSLAIFLTMAGVIVNISKYT